MVVSDHKFYEDRVKTNNRFNACICHSAAIFKCIIYIQAWNSYSSHSDPQLNHM